MEKIYDIMIIGSGPAGLSAAINAKIRNKDVIVISNRLSSIKLEKAPSIENYLGYEEIGGKALAEKFLNHARSMEIIIADKDIVALYDLSGLFGAMTLKQEIIKAKAVILTTGSIQKASIQGEDKLLGLGVSYCPTCDGTLYKGKKVAVIGYSPDAVEEANYLSEICEELFFISQTKNRADLGGELNENIKFIQDKVVSIDGDMKVNSITTSNEKIPIEAAFILREVVPVDKFIRGLELLDGNIKTDRNMATNIPGLFAAGDCTGKPYQISKATGEGQVAGLSASSYVDQMKN